MKYTKTSSYEKTYTKTYNPYLYYHQLLDDSKDIVNASMIAEEIGEHVKEQIGQSMMHDREVSLTITVTIEEN